jgi:hypothetical protein
VDHLANDGVGDPNDLWHAAPAADGLPERAPFRDVKRNAVTST